MNAKDVKKRIVHIKSVQNDAEAAHNAEDDLYLELLTSIAHNTCDDPQACATLAIATQKLKFNRYTA